MPTAGTPTKQTDRLRDKFVCQACETQANPDYNAAKNIAENCIRSDQQSSEWIGVRRYALKSGDVVPKWGFAPAT